MQLPLLMTCCAGVWFTLPGEDSPCATLIGSPNFGYRSLQRDLEAQIALVTENSSLRRQLAAERDHLFAGGSAVTEATFAAPDRQVKTWQSIVTRCIRDFL
eukprot:m.143378 g.143378  ORF g.143378 m.143378 type:complete len:101 (-) comp10050_c0_seq2:65-367(-)